MKRARLLLTVIPIARLSVTAREEGIGADLSAIAQTGGGEDKGHRDALTLRSGRPDPGS